MAGYIFFHANRSELEVKYSADKRVSKVYCDGLKGNQDPYVWNERFLNSFCKLKQYRFKEASTVDQNGYGNADIIFWCEPVNGQFLCDLVFVVETYCEWGLDGKSSTNYIDSSSDVCINDSHEAFINHYDWINKGEHVWQNSKQPRVTLKASADCSFQPLNEKSNRVDIRKLVTEAVGNDERSNMPVGSISGYGKKDLTNEEAHKLYNLICKNTCIKLKGKDFVEIYKTNQTIFN